jgi:photosystem II stability/assembly factor-like uncharacterized protein
MASRFLITCILALALAPAPAWAVQRGSVYEPLDLPAEKSPRATRANLFGIDRAGDRLVAVGQRGFVLYSDDQGDTWRQAEVPVRTTLLAVDFPTPSMGWAVGHDGVILHSADRGETWIKQMDGYQAIEQGLADYKARLAAEQDNETYRALVDEFLFAQAQGADRPFFFVWFEDEDYGVAVGAYNLAMRTFDGGAHWQFNMELQADLRFRHLYDYEVTADGRRYVAGEAGELWIQDEPFTRLRSVETFYDGSLYTITSTCSGEILLTAGLRGNAFASTDRGESWTKLEVPTNASINGSTCLGDDRLVLVTQAGEVLVSVAADDPLTFERLVVERPFPLSDVVEGRPGEVVAVGLGGVRTVPLN